MALISRKKLEVEVEKRILIGLITSDTFCAKMIKVAEIGYFKNRYMQHVFRWIKNYYTKYEKAPHKQIISIYESYIPKLPDTEMELIGELLSNLSEEFEMSTINEQFLVDETNTFFKRRKLEMIANNIQVLLDEDKVDEAQKQVIDYTLVMPGDDETTRPTNPKEVEQFFYEEEEEFFKFPGKLGEFMGNMMPGWLVAITGKTKGYKSFFMQEFAFLGATKYIPTIYYSLEMTKHESKKRWYKRIAPSSQNGGQMLYPIFDCVHNQLNNCEKEFRRNRQKLIQSDGTLPEFDIEIDYRACDYCRKRRELKRNYQSATWFTQIKMPAFDYHEVKDDIDSFESFYGPYYRLKIYPRFSKSVQDIENHLDVLKAVEGFIPRIIVIDYADILKQNGSAEGFYKEDMVWMELAALAGKRNALVVTGTQTDKAGQTTKNIGIKNTAKWIGKNFHLDKHFAINQSDEEKHQKVCRIGKILDRYTEFDENQSVLTLMNIDAGVFHIDSEL